MIFKNDQIDVTQLPAIDDVNYKKLDPAYLTLSYIGTAIFFGFLLIIVLIVTFLTPVAEITPLSWGLRGGWLLWLIIAFWLVKKSYRIKGYALRERDIIFRRGIIFRTVTSIPFSRVQHCEIKHGPIERSFGLNTLEIFTAGGQSSDLSIPGLPKEQAERLKEFIIKGVEENE